MLIAPSPSTDDQDTSWEAKDPSPTTSRVALVLSLIVLGFIALSAANAIAQSPSSQVVQDGAWLDAVNAYRASAGAKPVDASAELSGAALDHARYQILNQEITHHQVPSQPGHTERGAASGRNSNVAGTGDATLDDRGFIDLWMTAPFHALGLLRDDLLQVGFGVARDPLQPTIRAAATLDVLQGMARRSPLPETPRVWPGDGTVVPLLDYAGGESPDPLGACPGFEAPTGLPILIWWPDPLDGFRATVQVDGNTVRSCVVTGERFRASDPAAERLGRALLDFDNAALVIPAAPLPVSAEVRVDVGTPQREHGWSFRTSHPGSEIAHG